MKLFYVALIGFLMQVQAGPVSIPGSLGYLSKIQSLSEQCAIELQLKGKYLPPMKNGIFVEDNESLNTLFDCVFRKLRILDKKGEVDKDVLADYLTNLNTMVVPLAANRCKDVEAKNFGQKAIKIQNCLMDYVLKLMHKHIS